MELKFRENGEFSILAIADAQDTDNPQKETTDIIRYSIEKTSPDLIILLGAILQAILKVLHQNAQKQR